MYNESRKNSSIKYAKTHLKRIPLDVSIEFYEQIKEYADKHECTINGLIKELLQEKIKNN